MLTDDQRSSIDDLFARHDNTRSPGCSVAVGKEGQVAFSRCYGMANLDHDVPIRSNTVFHVASVSKQFTAASIALLALDGEIRLDANGGWTPEEAATRTASCLRGGGATRPARRSCSRSGRTWRRCASSSRTRPSSSSSSTCRAGSCPSPRRGSATSSPRP